MDAVSPHDPITPLSPCLWTLLHWGVSPQHIASGRHLKSNHNESQFFHHFLEFLHAFLRFSGHLQGLFPGPSLSLSAISLSWGQFLLVLFFSHIHYMVAWMFMLKMTFESHLWILETAFYPRFFKRFCFVSNWSKLLLPSSSGSFPYFLRHAHLNSLQKCLGCSYATHSTSRCFRAAPQAEQWPMKSTSFNMGNTWGRGETSVLLGNRLQSMASKAFMVWVLFPDSI